jgi:hypothetical protein
VLQILGFETCNICDSLKVWELIASHIESVRRLPGFEHAQAILNVESNLAAYATDIARFLAASHVGNVVMARQDPIAHSGGELRPGTRTSVDNKPEMIDMLKKYLDSGRVLVHKNFVVSQPEYSLYPDVQDQMLKELRGFTEFTILYPRDAAKRPKVIYHGKINGGRDDFVMSLAINVFTFGIFMTDARYAKYLRRG